MKLVARWSTLVAVTLFAGLVPPTVFAADQPGAKPPLKAGQYNPAHKSVDLFDGIKSGQIGVKLILKDSTQGRIVVENKTKQPLTVKLPEAFGGVPILAQRGGLGGGIGGVGGAGGQQQAVGGGAGGGMGGGGMGGGGGGGMFAIPAERGGDSG